MSSKRKIFSLTLEELSGSNEFKVLNINCARMKTDTIKEPKLLGPLAHYCDHTYGITKKELIKLNNVFRSAEKKIEKILNQGT